MRDISVYLKIGKKESPLCFFIHGLGMNLNIWVRPEESRVIGGSYPVSIFLSRPPRFSKNTEGIKRFTFGMPPARLKTPLHDLKDEGYTVLAYSQKRPVAGMDVLIEEIERILYEYSELTRKGVIFITHSRGGILARVAIENLDIKTLGLITIATPHMGTSMAHMAGMVSPITRIISSFFANSEQNTVRGAIKRVMDFLSSPAIKELSTDSPLIKKIKKIKFKGIKVISFGGTNPNLFTVYKWHKDCLKYRKMFSIPEILTGYLPERIIPDELRTGRGDSLVTDISAQAPDALAHYKYHQNHAALIFNRHLRKRVVEFVRAIG